MDDPYNEERSTAKQQREAAAAYEERLCGSFTQAGRNKRRHGISALAGDILWYATRGLSTRSCHGGLGCRETQGRHTDYGSARKAGVLEQIIREEAKNE